jgi:integrating conjugative element protein (TIGR03757 family)
MSFLNRVTVVLLMCLYWPLVLAAGPVAVTYIGSNKHPLVNAEAVDYYDVTLSVYNIDGHRNLEEQLSAGLPQNYAEAEKIANERLMAMDGKAVQDAFRGVALTLLWDLKRVPAIVFGDGEQVIYGVTDLSEALKRYSFFRSRTR